MAQPAASGGCRVGGQRAPRPQLEQQQTVGAAGRRQDEDLAILAHHDHSKAARLATGCSLAPRPKRP
eukprot:14294276-Alexandrium_andersonii.AAC.1